MSRVDVVVAGSGPAGSAAAVVLARAGVSVHLLATDRSRHGWAGESLPPGAEALIEAVFGDGILTEPPHVRAYGVRGAWGSADLVDTDFMSHPLGDGWHLDRAVFDRQICAAAAAAGAVIAHGPGVTGVERTPGGWQVQSGMASLEARWVVDATGRAGAVVGRLGIPRTRLDRQVAEVAVVGDADQAAVTTIEAAPDGWWYSTPVPGGRRVVAFLTDVDLWNRGQEGGAAFGERLAATIHIANLVDEVGQGIVSRSYPADTSRRAQLTGRRWAAVGDSAITWDPLSSQGIVSGVLMGARVASAIVESLGSGSSEALLTWEDDYRLLLDEHTGLRAYYATAEQRWPESPFWTRRSVSDARLA